MPKKNIELLKRLRTRFLRMRPEHFNMYSVASKTECGTSMCIAGHALDLQGYKAKFIPTDWGTTPAQFVAPGGRKVNPLTAAAREMGLSRLEANDLFYDFSLETPKQAAERIERLITQGE